MEPPAKRRREADGKSDLCKLIGRAVTDDLQVLQKKLAFCVRNKENVSDEFIAKLQVLNKDLSEENKILKEEAMRIDHVKESLRETEKQISDWKTNQVMIEKQFVCKQRELKDIELKVSIKTEELSILSSKEAAHKNHLKNEIHQLVQRSQTKLKELENKCTKLKMTINKKEKAITDKTMDLKKLNTLNKEKDKECNQQKLRIEELQAEKEEYMENIDTLGADLRTIKETNIHIKSALKESKSRLNEVKRDNTNISSKIERELLDKKELQEALVQTQCVLNEKEIIIARLGQTIVETQTAEQKAVREKGIMIAQLGQKLVETQMAEQKVLREKEIIIGQLGLTQTKLLEKEGAAEKDKNSIVEQVEKKEVIIANKTFIIENLRSELESQKKRLLSNAVIRELQETLDSKDLLIKSTKEDKEKELTVMENTIDEQIEKINMYKHQAAENVKQTKINKALIYEKEQRAAFLEKEVESSNKCVEQSNLEINNMKIDYHNQLDDMKKYVESKVTEKEKQLDDMNKYVESKVTEKEKQVENLQAALKERESRPEEHNVAENTLFGILAEKLGEDLSSVERMEREEREHLLEVMGVREEGRVAASARTRELEEQARRAGERLECAICSEEEVGVVFQPCGHLCCCQACGARREVKKCPICRTNIEERVKTFLP